MYACVCVCMVVLHGEKGNLKQRKPHTSRLLRGGLLFRTGYQRIWRNVGVCGLMPVTHEAPLNRPGVKGKKGMEYDGLFFWTSSFDTTFLHISAQTYKHASCRCIAHTDVNKYKSIY